MLLTTLWNSISYVVGLIASAASAIWGTIFGLIEWAGAQVLDLLGRIADGIAYVADWAWHNIFQPLLNMLGQVLQYLLEAIQTALQWIYATFLKPILDAAAFLADQVGQLWSHVFGVVDTVVHVVLAALDWLLWFARHTLTHLISLVVDIFTKGSSWWINQVMTGLENEIGAMADRVASWIG